MPERPRGRDPVPLPDYRHAVRFPDEPTSNTAYEQTRDVMKEEACDISLYRTVLLPSQDWHLLVLGSIPEEPVQERIYKALEGGEAVELPKEVWQAFNQRRLEQTGKGTWTERRYGRRLR